MIRFDQVTKKFPDGTEALKDVSISIPTGELTAIIGPSGCGKTTLMKMINRLEVPTRGDILIDEKSIRDTDQVELRRSIGYVIQRIGLLPHMTIEKNAGLVPKLKGWTEEKTQLRVRDLMSTVGLEPETYLSRYPLELSGGQQQRVGVVRALAGDPNIVLMDEPFSALDPISREQLQKELRSLQQRIQKTIVFVTHDMDEALKIADNIIVMREGRIEQIGSPHELIHEPVNEFVRNFIGQERIDRQRTFGQLKLQELSSFFTQARTSEEIANISSTDSIETAIYMLEQPNVNLLAIHYMDNFIGYIDQTSLLRAFIAKEEGGINHD
ncbi:MAG: betaine/proline/choline family ABC transporter ATP-binding protein [Paenisporosarcina sp.]